MMSLEVRIIELLEKEKRLDTKAIIEILKTKKSNTYRILKKLIDREVIIGIGDIRDSRNKIYQLKE